MFILFSYYFCNKNILISIILGTFVYLIPYNFQYIYQLYIIDLLFTILKQNNINIKNHINK